MAEYRFFRATPANYDAVRLSLDAAWGLPANGQETCIPPASICCRTDGYCYLAARRDWCEYEAVSASLPTLLASGTVTELSEPEFLAGHALPFRE